MVVDFSTISIRVTSCRTHGLKSIGENAKSSQPAGGHFLTTHPCFLLGETSLKGEAFLIRYADDFVIGVAREEDARRIMASCPSG